MAVLLVLFDVENLGALGWVLPGGALLDLVRLSYDATSGFAGQFGDALPAIGVLIAWTLLGGFAAKRLFRWGSASEW